MVIYFSTMIFMDIIKVGSSSSSKKKNGMERSIIETKGLKRRVKLEDARKFVRKNSGGVSFPSGVS